MKKVKLLWDLARELLNWKKSKPAKVLFAPNYDTVTKRTSKWVESWDLEGVEKYTGKNANYQTARQTIQATTHDKRLLFFIGHGAERGLLTAPTLGKVTSATTEQRPWYLLNSEDLTPEIQQFHCVAWACKAGLDFGLRHKDLRYSGFLGFNGDIAMIVNHEPSERLWSSLVKNLFFRILENGQIGASDDLWLRDLLLTMRQDIREGRVDTGSYNVFNSIFLKAAAKMTCAHIAEE